MEPKIASVWPEWSVVKRLGGGSFGQVYEVVREKHGITERSAVKIISVPVSNDEVTGLKSDGMSVQEITAYYEGMVAESTQEIRLMSELRGHTNIVGYEDFDVVKRTDTFGWDIFIRMELMTPLPMYMEDCLRVAGNRDEFVEGLVDSFKNSGSHFDSYDVVSSSQIYICDNSGSETASQFFDYSFDGDTLSIGAFTLVRA